MVLFVKKIHKKSEHRQETHLEILEVFVHGDRWKAGACKEICTQLLTVFLQLLLECWAGSRVTKIKTKKPLQQNQRHMDFAEELTHKTGPIAIS